jgi:hypothetical protein
MKYYIRHGYYGCETGCCGTTFESEDGKHEGFTFWHPDTDDQTLEAAKKHFKDRIPLDAELVWEYDGC